jgi:hypothetical protein
MIWPLNFDSGPMLVRGVLQISTHSPIRLSSNRYDYICFGPFLYRRPVTGFINIVSVLSIHGCPFTASDGSVGESRDHYHLYLVITEFNIFSLDSVTMNEVGNITQLFS